MDDLTHIVSPEEEGRTVKSVALKEMRLSRGQFSSLKFSGNVYLDGAPVRADKRLRAGQALSVRFPGKGGAALTPYPADVAMVYADAYYWVVGKPAPLPTLSSARQTGPTLENGLYAFLGCPEGYVFRPVNRLDKGTSGLMTVARSAHAQQLLQKQLHTDDFRREYLAVCEGRMAARSGVIDLPIRKGIGTKREAAPDGVRAVTHYRVEREAKGRSLVRLRLETGRTHQIRVHLAAMGCPIVGDYLYGRPADVLPGRFALHSCLVRFRHPITGQEILCTSPLPDALAALLAE